MQRDAVLAAVDVEAAHGLPRTAADKRKAVGALLADPEWAKWRDREIARRCAVGPVMVSECGAICSRRTDGEPDATRKVNRGGKTYTQDTSGQKVAGAKKAATTKPTPAPAAPPAPSPERVKEAARAAAETALQDDGMPIAEDEHAQSVVELLAETQRLTDQITLLASGSDDKAEIAKWHRLYEDASRKQRAYGNRIADLDGALRALTRHQREIGKFAKGDRPTKDLPVVREYVKKHGGPGFCKTTR